MARTSADFWADSFSEVRGVNSSSNGNGNRNGNSNCDPDSSAALKEIVSLLDDLNNSDLRLLDQIVERFLCERRC